MLERVVVVALERRQAGQRLRLGGFVEQRLNVAIELLHVLLAHFIQLDRQLGERMRPASAA